MSAITREEQEKYWQIFSGLSPVDNRLTGEQAAAVLASSGLPESDLERLWDLCDIDNDGMLDFEEFSIAMKLLFDVLQGSLSSIPAQLPGNLVPSSKAHLLTAQNALSHGLDMERVPSPVEETDAQGNRLSGNFDWYMSPTDKASYESIYNANADRRGAVKFNALSELYGTLQESVPLRDIERAWDLINPKRQEGVGKDQVLCFLHILNQRSNGIRVPTSVPPTLRATFAKSEISYDTSKYDKSGKLKSTIAAESEDRQSGGGAFGSSYLTKLGTGSRGAKQQKPADYAEDIKDGDWELVRLKRELVDLDEQIAAAEQASHGEQAAAQTGLIRRELEQLLAFKNAELARLDASSRDGPGSGSLKSVQEDIDMFKQQVDSLNAYLADRQATLAKLEKERDALQS
ncbi:actin cytoskeleton-regulatory complex protein END3-domain-containing protein [Protomyces lactucae-debilis]|uniref:Endocytosis protein 3 n=1 Tax=Protomyces lactucae-debilis TaxID=2754530 RepID=A0A1Y2FUD2_PROLT|nr:actin cytoskeleton-regulatory complex protein END3-domain-containing protein [Protomyces lactucae-debilis]ORY87620.1 actin cytoskeleton-regulatory complex protein END3-domain-containing protein [Protomyces lactucae-debilis]